MNQDKLESLTAYWALWVQKSNRDVSIENQIDQMLTDYQYYPEIEWSKFGYRPPENHPILGSWRDNTGNAFLFLLDKTPKQQSEKHKQLLLYAVGSEEHIDRTDRIISSFKIQLTRVERKDLRGKDVDSLLERDKRGQSIERLMKLNGLFTIIINGFSLYLRTLSPPEFPIMIITTIYQFLLIGIHLTALLLLLLNILICLIYSFRYGLLLIKRLWS